MINESKSTPMQAALMDGLSNLSGNQKITFTLYSQWILPGDGFVFWVRSDLLRIQPSIPLSIDVVGSLHYDSNQTQYEDESIAVQKIVFTTNQEVAPFNELESTTMYMGEFQNLVFSFTARTMYYQQSGLYHYYGDAVYPAMSTQIINTAQELLDTSNVVSNSLPIWLGLNQYMSIYPSYLVPTNLTPPYAVINIDTDTQSPLLSMPILDSNSNQWQLVKERVKVVIYGLRNNQVMDYLRYIYDNSLNDEFGILNNPIPKDLIRTQSEINVRGQKKVIEFEISYFQNRMRDIARKLVLNSMVTVINGDNILYDSNNEMLLDSTGQPLMMQSVSIPNSVLNNMLYDANNTQLSDSSGLNLIAGY